MGFKLLFSVFTLCIVHSISATLICYHGTWSRYRSGNGTFAVSTLDPTLCTHYIYTFVGLDSSTNKVTLLDEWLDIGLNGFGDAVALKQRNPDLKVLVAVGGWNEGSEKYSVMASAASSRAVFIQSALELVETYSFDGFDLDWEYPADRHTLSNPDKENFALLIKEFSAVFKPKGLLLTAAVGATPAKVDSSYDVPVLSEYLDFINIMAYDFHGIWDSTTGHNAPLLASARYAGTTAANFNLYDSVRYWLAQGADPAKLALGVPIYGRTFTLTTSDTAPGAAHDGNGGPAGPYTQQAGFWGYNEIIEKFNEGGWTEAFDSEQNVPYAYKDSVWISYDNPASIKLKVDFAKSLGLGAIMVWSVETDDFHGLSGTTFPILKAINSALGTENSSSSDVEEEESTESSASDSALGSSDSETAVEESESESASESESSDSSDTSSSNECTAVGYFRDSSDCSKYYYCQEANGVFYKSELTCPSGLYFDLTSSTCNYQSAVAC